MFIWATGRKPNVQDLNLEAAGVTLNEKGFIAVDEYQNTVIPWRSMLLGDVTGEKRINLSLLKLDALFLNDYSMEKSMPKWIIQISRTVVFSHPAIGTVGLTEEEAQQTYGKRISKSILLKFASMYTAVLNTASKQI